MERIKKIRPVLQMEAAECGAASLAMILGCYGKTVTLEELRQECGVSRDGVNAKNIAKAAQFHGLKFRAVRVNLEGVKKIKTPAIIHWNMDHFLVLRGFHKNGAALADPAYGLRTVSMDEFSNSFTGIALEFTPTEQFQKDSGKKSEGYIASCIRPLLPNLIYFILLELCALIAGISALFLNSVFINRIIIGGNLVNLRLVLQALLCAGAMGAAAAALNETIRHRLGKQLNIRINSGFIEHLLRLPIDFFTQRSEGDLANRQNATMLLGMNISRLMSPFPGYLLQIAILLIVTVALDAHIALIGVACAAANLVAMVISSGKYEEKTRAYGRDMGVLQGDISQAVDMIETVKSCGAENAMFARLMAAGTQAINRKTEIDKTGVYTGGLFTFLNVLGSASVLIAGVWKILSGSMSTGILIASQALVAAMLSPVGAAVNTGTELAALKGEIARANDVIHYGTDDKFLEETALQSGELDGELRLENVSFGYSPLELPFIKDFNLHVKKGGSAAFTGESGCGKSTAAKLIAGLYRESGGRITFSGLTRNEIDHYYFYSRVAMVSQSIRLFEGTVLENITMWDDDISYDDVVAAAKAACIHEDIISRRGGYRELVTENGKNFSGGQRQRIEIARALVKKPSLIILDEATSALDSDTEERVMRNIEDLGITRIVVAHRLSAIKDSDEIIVMDHGEALERGTHHELMEKQGAYFTLVRSEA